MFNMFLEWIQPFKDKLDNLLRIGSVQNTSGTDAQLQEIQLKILENIKDAYKVGQFGFNSKPPINSRCIVARIGNENIVIANEHISSIIDVESGEAILYNETGNYIKITSSGIEVKGETTFLDNVIMEKALNVTNDITCLTNGIYSGTLSASSYAGINGTSMSTNVNIEAPNVIVGGKPVIGHDHNYYWTDNAGSDVTNPMN